MLIVKGIDAHLATYNAAGAVSGDSSILAIVLGALKELYAEVQEYFARTDRWKNASPPSKRRSHHQQPPAPPQ